jgi:hypothetical protein
MISIKITTFLALMWVQTQKLTHTNPIFLGWVQLLKTHRITQPGLGYDGLGWVQSTSFRRVLKSRLYRQKFETALTAFEILLLVENDLQRIRKKTIELDDVEREEKFSHKRHDEKSFKSF